MNLYKIGLALIFSGIILAVMFVILGFGSFAIFVVFPVIYGNNPVMFIPFVLIFIGVLVMMASPFTYRAPEEQYPGGKFEFREEEPSAEKKKGKFGAVIMVGPIPIILGNDRKLIYISIVLTIVALLIFFFYYLRR